MLILIKYSFKNVHGVKNKELSFLLLSDTANTVHFKLITFNIPLNV